MPFYDAADEVLSGRNQPDAWGPTLAALAQGLASIPERRMQQQTLALRQQELQQRGQAQQQEQLAKQRAAEMGQVVSRIVQEAMVDSPDGKIIDRKRLQQGFLQSGVPVEALSSVLKSLDDVDASLSKFTQARREHAADVLNAIYENGATPEAATLGIAYGKANGWLNDQEIEPIYQLLASDRDIKPVVKQLRDSLTGRYREKAEDGSVVVPAGGTLADKKTGKVLYSAPTKPADAPNVGSFEDYTIRYAQAKGKKPEELTPADVEDARKRYQQADDRPIRISTGGNANLTPNMESNVINRLSNQWTAASKPARELERQVSIMDAGMKAAERGDLAQGAQAVLVTFQKILDPTSVVRESEFDRSAAGQSLMNRARGFMERLSKGGAGVPLPELQKFANLARELATAQRGSRLKAIQERLGKTADRYKIPRELVFESESPAGSVPGASDAEGWTDLGNGVRVRKKR